MPELSIGLGLFGSGSGQAQAWSLKNCQVLIEPEAGEKSRFSVSGRVFAITDCMSIADHN